MRKAHRCLDEFVRSHRYQPHMAPGCRTGKGLTLWRGVFLRSKHHAFGLAHTALLRILMLKR